MAAKRNKMTGSEGPGDPSLGDVARQVREQVDHINEVPPTNEVWSRIVATHAELLETIKKAGSLAAELAIAAETDIMPLAKDASNRANQAHGVFYEAGKGSSNTDIIQANAEISSMEHCADVEHDDAHAIALTATLGLAALSSFQTDLEMIANRIGLGAAAAGDKMRHRDQAAGHATDFADGL